MSGVPVRLRSGAQKTKLPTAAAAASFERRYSSPVACAPEEAGADLRAAAWQSAGGCTFRLPAHVCNRQNEIGEKDHTSGAMDESQRLAKFGISASSCDTLKCMS